MPRLPRVYIEGGLYYITSRGEQNQLLFNDRKDYEVYLDLVSKYKKQFGFRLYAFSLLPTHLHLLIELRNEVTISAIMHSLNSLYTKRYNSRYQKKGHLFNSRYKAIIAEKEPCLVKLIRHIHLNPKRLNLSESPVEFQYSSARVYRSRLIEGVPQDPSLPDMKEEIDEVLSRLSQEGMETVDFIYSADEDEDRELSALLRRRRFLGSSDFGVKVKRELKSVTEKKEKSMVPAQKKIVAFVSAFLLVSLFTGGMSYHFYTTGLSTQERIESVSQEISKRVVFLRQLQTRSLKAVKEEPREQIKGLSGSIWEVELIVPSSEKDKKEIVRDVLNFSDRKFSSSFCSAQGLRTSNYSVSRQEDGKVVWETMQTAADGSTATWYGEWQGKTMKGILSYRPAGKESRNFSFMSRRGEYHEEI